MSSKTGTEIVYKPDPDIDIKEFKQEPMNVSEMISCLSSETNSQSELRHISSETETEIVYKPVHDIDIEEFKQEPMDVFESFKWNKLTKWVFQLKLTKAQV